MAECITEEKIERINSITGNSDRNKFLYWQLKESFKTALKIDFIVSFLMESGVKMLLPDLREAINRGVKIRILTGRYLGITQPSALYLLRKEFGDKIDLRFYYTPIEHSFHPKAYFFHKQNDSEVFIGSSNISRSALTNGVEWNYRLSAQKNKDDFDDFYTVFEDLFNNHSILIDDDELKLYAKNWRKPAVSKDLEKNGIFDTNDVVPLCMYEPRGVQIEALYALEQSRREGADKGLIQATTGIGKTYLAAFDSKQYQRILFVAHREEILSQAVISFRNVRCEDDYGFFNGTVHDTNKSVIFASVASLGKDEYLTEEYFSPDYFDYIVIDEFHHAVNNQYKKIIDYFKPKFLLGLTATPDRMDGRSIYELCDYNVPYEINLYQAINRGILVPFHYYGIYDETDYSKLKFVKGDYLESDLNIVYLDNEVRDTLIFKHYTKYQSKKALGFCCSRKHAEYMARVFSQRGIPSVAVYSNSDGDYSENRSKAIQMLNNGNIRVIFSVDMFNEGVDIPEIDMVMFLRPTQSSVVFLQQLGRGLRTSKGKEFLTVLDFIGNYRFAGKTVGLLSGHAPAGLPQSSERKPDYPEGCLVDFDMELIDLFHQMNKQKISIHETIHKEFFRIQELLDGKVPSRMDLFTYMDESVYKLCLANTKENPFKDYLSFLDKLNLLSTDEKFIAQSIVHDFLIVLEKTSMTKSYKMPVLSSFIDVNKIRSEVNDEILLNVWKDFYRKNGNWKDLGKSITYQSFLEITDKEHLANIKKNPVYFLKQSSLDFFISTSSASIALSPKLLPFLNNEVFVQQFKDIVEYRTMDYYSRRYREANW